jgi:hypothetical protein
MEDKPRRGFAPERKRTADREVDVLSTGTHRDGVVG